MDAAVEAPIPGPSTTQRPPRVRSKRKKYAHQAGQSTESPLTDSQRNLDQTAPRRTNGPQRGAMDRLPRSGSPSTTAVNDDGAPRKRAPRPRPPKSPSELSTQTPENSSEGDRNKPPLPPGGRGRRRGAKFNAGLTDSGSTPTPSSRYRGKASTIKSPAPTDLMSTLVHALSTPPYPDCPICFSPIHPAQRTWSCSPSIPVIRPEGEGEEQQYCWTTFHVKCIGEWAAKSVRNISEAWIARGEHGKKGEWRCPGCQAKREIVPSGYWCFCNSTPEPKPPRLATPHSCGNPCSRPRESRCGHPCPLACHPGPCPPCQVTTRLQCYCPQKKVIAFRCGVDSGKRDLSCGAVCGRALGCSKHVCAKICHEGSCGECAVREVATCWCGELQREVGCGEGEEVACVDGETGRSWTGRFACDLTCQKLFNCGIHKCEQPCHPPHTPTSCPLSPANITHCPCGTHPIAQSGSPTPADTSAPTPFPPRTHCTSPIPTCSSECAKPHPGCEHPCTAKCHTGLCPPCTVSIVRPCRCGATTRGVRCFELRAAAGEVKEILCDKPCMALRACGRHQCRRVCCPLASLAGRKGRKRGAREDVGVGEEHGGLHECDLVCGKMLGCGNHRCEERDHRGPCAPCLRSSFEELICPCGRTILDPPIPCGTQLHCNYPCQRPPPPCGHPLTPHTCHEAQEGSLCPPCPSLTMKRCACGKKTVGNVKCSLDVEKVSCGSVCGKLMMCGFHHCERLCHAGECGACTAPCGKSRRNCLPQHHACPLPCHAPSTCPEDTPCQSLVTLSCPCGRIRQSVHCGRSTTNTSGHAHLAPKCNNECAVAKRNARLAEALGISGETREKAAMVTYHEEVLAFARVNAKFVGVVERAFEEFVNSQKKTQILPPMPPERRKFVHDLAAVYRIDTQMVDQEPHRSVRLLRRLDTRIPSPLLSSVIATNAPTPPSLGKLADLRAATPTWRSGPAPTLVVAKPASSSSLVSGPRWAAAAARPTSAASMAPKPLSASAVATPRLTSSAGVTRASTPTPVSAIPSTPTAVPDSWEDDV